MAKQVVEKMTISSKEAAYVMCALDRADVLIRALIEKQGRASYDELRDYFEERLEWYMEFGGRSLRDRAGDLLEIPELELEGRLVQVKDE